LLLVKAGTAAVYCLVAALTVAVAGLIAGSVLFPIGRVTTLSGTTLSLAEGMLRTFAAALVVGMSFFGLAAIGLFISTLTDVPVGAMAATVGLAIFSAILDSVPQVHAIHPWLFTHHWLAFGDLLRSPVTWHEIGKDLTLQAGYVAVFGAAAWARFSTKDVLA
jgi:ABC-2 type transport system permease protein